MRLEKIVEIFKKYNAEILIFFSSVSIALFVLGVFFLLGGKNDTFPITNSDSQEYFDLAENILEYKQFILLDNKSGNLIHETFRSPGYPFFLSLVLFLFRSVAFVTYIQIIILALSAVLTYKISSLFLSKKISIGAAILFMVEPGALYHSYFVLSETLFGFLLLVSVYLFLFKLKKKSSANYILLLVGIALGMMTMTRAVGQYLVAVLSIFYIFYQIKNKQSGRKMLLNLGVLMAGFFIIVSPWSFRNYALFGTFTLSSTPGYILMKNYIPFFYMHKYGVSLDETMKFFFQHQKLDPNFSPRSMKYTKEFKNQALAYIKDNFLEYSVFHILKTIPFFLNDSVRDYIAAIGPPDPENWQRTNVSGLILKGEYKQLKDIFINGVKSGNAYLISALISLMAWLIVDLALLWCLITALRFKNKEISFFFLFCLSIILFFALSTGPLSNARYRLPTEPFMFILTAYVIGVSYKKIRGKINRHEV